MFDEAIVDARSPNANPAKYGLKGRAVQSMPKVVTFALLQRVMIPFLKASFSASQNFFCAAFNNIHLIPNLRKQWEH
jgi:hypothetical protein